MLLNYADAFSADAIYAEASDFFLMLGQKFWIRILSFYYSSVHMYMYTVFKAMYLLGKCIQQSDLYAATGLLMLWTYRWLGGYVSDVHSVLYVKANKCQEKQICLKPRFLSGTYKRDFIVLIFKVRLQKLQLLRWNNIIFVM